MSRLASTKRPPATEQLRRSGAVFEARRVDCFTGAEHSTRLLEGWWVGRIYLAATAAAALKVLKS